MRVLSLVSVLLMGVVAQAAVRPQNAGGDVRLKHVLTRQSTAGGFEMDPCETKADCKGVRLCQIRRCSPAILGGTPCSSCTDCAGFPHEVCAREPPKAGEASKTKCLGAQGVSTAGLNLTQGCENAIIPPPQATQEPQAPSFPNAPMPSAPGIPAPGSVASPTPEQPGFPGAGTPVVPSSNPQPSSSTAPTVPRDTPSPVTAAPPTTTTPSPSSSGEGEEQASPSPSHSEGSNDGETGGSGNDQDVEPEESPICIAVEHLEHLGPHELVFDAHLRARVLCDAQGSCATPGHIVVFRERPMMMKSYCAVARGGCAERRTLVNSPRFRPKVRVPSNTDGLHFTALAARFETRLEEHMLKMVVRSGL